MRLTCSRCHKNIANADRLHIKRMILNAPQVSYQHTLQFCDDKCLAEYYMFNKKFFWHYMIKVNTRFQHTMRNNYKVFRKAITDALMEFSKRCDEKESEE